MNLKKLNISFLRETIFRLLEEETKYQPGDKVSSKDGEGVVRLSKHPYYSVTIDSTGVTKSFHFNEIEKIEGEDGEFGKYDINESSSENLIKFTGMIILKDDVWMTDILSSVRSITGITIVRNEDIETIDRNEKARLHIKIDPYPFGSQSAEKIERIIISKITKIPGVKSFSKIRHEDKPKEKPTITQSPIPVSSIEDLQEIKINNPTRLQLIPGNYYDILKARGKQAIKEYNRFPRFCSLEEINGEKVLWELGYKYKGIETIEFDTGTDTFHQFVEPWDGEELGWGIEDVKRWIDNNLMRRGSKQKDSMNEIRFKIKDPK